MDLLAVRQPKLVRSVLALNSAHGAQGAEVAWIPGRLTMCQEYGARAVTDFASGVLSGNAPTRLRTAHVRTLLGTPEPASIAGADAEQAG